MVKKGVFFLILVLYISVSCKQRNIDIQSVSTSEDKKSDFRLLAIEKISDISLLPKEITYNGNIKEIIYYIDSTGKYFVFTT